MPVCSQCAESRISHSRKYLSCDQMAQQGRGGWKSRARLHLREGTQSTREGRATSMLKSFSFHWLGESLEAQDKLKHPCPIRSGFRDASFAGARGSSPSRIPVRRQPAKRVVLTSRRRVRTVSQYRAA